jgi:hypothetical protein
VVLFLTCYGVVMKCLAYTERKLEQLELNKAKKFGGKFEIQNEEKRIIFGMAMEADKKIYRYDEARGEYYVYLISKPSLRLQKSGQ